MIQLLDFCTPSPEQYQKLLNNPSVRKHMPLSHEVTDDWCADWMKAKRGQWDQTGAKGPWSVWIDNEFAGWSGLQPDQEFESGLAMVLFKQHWGMGLSLLLEVIEKSLALQLARQTVIEFPLSRNADKVLLRLGFRAIEDAQLNGIVFKRYIAELTDLLERLKKH